MISREGECRELTGGREAENHEDEWRVRVNFLK